MAIWGAGLMPTVPRLLAVAAVLAASLVAGATRAESERLRKLPVRIIQSMPEAHWTVRKSDAVHCLAAERIIGAEFRDPQQTDLIMENGARYRLTFAQACPELGYYTSFYYHYGRDRKFCSGRDPVITRAGTACAVRDIVRLHRVRSDKPAGTRKD